MSGATRSADLQTEYLSTPAQEWDDPSHEGDPTEWPYPTRYTRRQIEGPLADAIRRRLNVDSDTPVVIVEEEHSGGWSEYTQENDFSMVIQCGGVVKEISSWGFSTESNLNKLFAWLDGGE